MTEIPWTWLGIRASGITAWGLLTAVVLWGILLRTRLLGRLASPMRLLDLHRWLGATALAFLLVHMILLLIDPAVQFTVAQVLVPGLAPWEPIAAALGTIAFWLLIPVSFIGRLRPRLGKVGNTWFKRSHLIAYAAWPIATAHCVLAGTAYPFLDEHHGHRDEQCEGCEAGDSDDEGARTKESHAEHSAALVLSTRHAPIGGGPDQRHRC